MLRMVRSLLEPNNLPRKPTIPSVNALNLSVSFSQKLMCIFPSVLMVIQPFFDHPAMGRGSILPSGATDHRVIDPVTESRVTQNTSLKSLSRGVNTDRGHPFN